MAKKIQADQNKKALLILGVVALAIGVYWFGFRPQMITKKCDQTSRKELTAYQTDIIDKEIAYQSSFATLSVGNNYLEDIKQLKGSGKIDEAFNKISSVTASGNAISQKLVSDLMDCTKAGYGCDQIKNTFYSKVSELNQRVSEEKQKDYYYECLRSYGYR